MYNKEQKTTFIAYYMNFRVISVDCIWALFEKVSFYEENLGKDCSEFTKDEILDMYKQMKTKSYSTLLTYTTILRAYTGFINNDKNKCAGYGEIGIHDMYGCIDKKDLIVLSRDEVDYIESYLVNKSDIAIVECLFEGIAGKLMCELTSITKDMIDDDKYILHLETRDVKLTPKLYAYLQDAFKESVYVADTDRMISYDLEPGAKLYKAKLNRTDPGTKDDLKNRYKWVCRKIAKIRQSLDIPGIDPKKLQISGAVHYIRNGMEASGLDLRRFLNAPNGQEIVRKYRYATTVGCYNAVLPYIM